MRHLVAAVLCSLVLVAAPAYAQQQPNTAAQIKALQDQLDALKAQIDALKAQQLQQMQVQQQQPKPAATAQAYVRLKPGNTVTFLVGKKDEVTVYGHLDLSYDDATKGLAAFYPSSGDGPLGNRGWMQDISTNLSYAGIRGFHVIGPQSKLLYQLETQIDISNTSGLSASNSNTS